MKAPVLALRYVETSAILAALLEGDAAARTALRAEGRPVTSALTFAEASRALVRARTAGRLTADQAQAAVRTLQSFERRCDVVGGAERGVGAAAFVTRIRTRWHVPRGGVEIRAVARCGVLSVDAVGRGLGTWDGNSFAGDGQIDRVGDI